MPTNTARRAKLPIMIAAWVLVAVIALIGSGLAGTTQAQGTSGVIPSINLDSNEAGQLIITWATPEQEPTDYRLMWANTNLGFPSYKNPNEAERANEYPLGDVTTITLNNLTPGDSYKVKIRSRYYNADRSVRESSGPWTSTATQRVKDNPPAAPTGLTASLVEHNSLTLTWNNPQDTNITGYRIQRGTDANSLHTIEANTGSASTEYQDATVEPETTYHYAVKALSQDGAGTQSTTLSATTPAAPKKGAPPPQSVGPRQSTTTTFISNTGQTSNNASTLARATAFTTGTDTYTLSSVGIFHGLQGSVTQHVQIYGHGSSGHPGALVATMNNPSTIANGVNVYTAPANTTLSASTTYWVITSNSAATNGQGFRVSTGTNVLDSGAAAGWSIGSARYKTDINAASWTTSTSRHLFQIRGTGGTTTNTAPTVANTIPDQMATVGTEFSYTVPADTFNDTDTDDTLTYSAKKADDSALPTWLAFDTSTRIFSGTPTAAETVSVKVTASDGTASVSDEFDITVSAILVPANWSLKPTGLTDGDQFRLIFLSSTKRDAMPTDIATYNTFVQDLAAAGHADIRGYSTGFKVVGCTEDVDARDNTSTTGTGVPIYWLDGNKVADTYADFYDLTWDDEANDKNESGNDAHNTSQAANYPLTGCAHNGTEAIAGINSRALGMTVIRVGRPNSSTAGHSPLSGPTNATNTDTRPMYGLSAVFQLDTIPPTLVSATVSEQGQVITLQFSENLQQSVNHPVSAFTVTADTKAVTINAIEVGQSGFPHLTRISTPVIRQGQAVVVTYTDPTTDDDAQAVQDLAGNDVATFTTGADGVPPVTNNSTASNKPVLTNPIPDQPATVGVAFSYTFPANTFTDPDAGDTLTYAATTPAYNPLPSWLNFTPATRTFTGTTTTTATISVRVTAIDSTDRSVSDIFDIVVSTPSTDATLSALSVSPKDIIGFAANRTSYEVGVASTVPQVTIVATTNDSAATVEYSTTDADGTASDHQVNLSAGRPRAVTVTVTAEDTTTTQTYTLGINRGVDTAFGWKASDDFDGLIAAENEFPRGLWSDGTTMWVVDAADTKLTAYNLDTKARDASKDFDTLSAAGNSLPFGIWSNTTTMWVADYADSKIYAYSMTTKAHDAGKDIPTAARPAGIWSDGTTMWVANQTPTKIHAYTLDTGVRDAGKDFDTLAAADNDHPGGIWSNNITMWVPDREDDKIYAYNLASKARDAGKDFDTLIAAGNRSVNGIWANTDTMWVSDSQYTKIYSYNMPAINPEITAPNVFRVPAVLGVDLRGITDTDGVTNIATNATYKWQRFNAAGTTLETDSIGTGSTYTLTDTDAGKTLKVVVNFTDDANNSEGPLTSAATSTITAAATDCNAPTYVGGATQLGPARTVTIAKGNNSNLGLEYGFLKSDAYGSLDNATFTTATAFEILGIYNIRALTYIRLDKALSRADRKQLALYVCNQAYPFDNRRPLVNIAYLFSKPPQDWSPYAERTIYLSQDTAAPTFVSATVNGTTLVITLNEPLDTAASLANSAFTVKKGTSGTTQALSGTPSISGSSVTLTLSTAVTATDTAVKVAYTKPTSGSANKLVDTFGNETATFTDQVVSNNVASGVPTISGTAAVGQTLTASTTGISDTDGLPSVFNYQWKRVDTDGRSNPTNIGTDSATFTLTDDEVGKKVLVEVSFTDNANNREGPLVSAAFPSSGTVSVAPTQVPDDWNLIPTGLAAGDQFRLLFLSSTKRNASSTDIATYNTFVQGRADAGHAHIQSYSAGFRAVGCTAAVDARDNTSTIGTGVPIYWLDGTKVADDYADFYDGSWDDEINDKNESGADAHDTSQEDNYPFTGCMNDGTEEFTGVNSRGLGDAVEGFVRIGRLNSSGTLQDPIDGNDVAATAATRPMYGLSGVFQVAPDNTPPSAANGTVTTNEDTAYTFTAVDFSYSDIDSDPLSSVAITTLPAANKGTLTLDGAIIASENLPKTVTATELNDNKLKYSPPRNAHQAAYTSFNFKVNDGITDSVSENTITIDVTAVNDPATGKPTISGTADVGEILTASTVDIADPDGLPSVFTYEWQRFANNGITFETIVGTNSNTYTIVTADEGKRFKVKVTFMDLDGNSEGPLLSDDYPRTRSSTCRARPSTGTGSGYDIHPGRWCYAGNLLVDGTRSGVIQGGFTSVGRYQEDIIDYFELTDMTAGTTYQLNLEEPGVGGGHIVAFYTSDGAGLFFESRGDHQNDGYTSTPLRQALFTPSNSSRYFVSIRGVFATRDIDYTVALVEPAPDDIPASASTTAEGNSSNGVIEKLYDVDWHRTDNLSAGTEYVVYLKGADANGLFDPFIVGIYNPQGDLIEGNSDNRRGIGRDASVVFTPPTYGRHYVAVSSAPEPFQPRTIRDSTGKGHTGAYALTVSAVSSDPSNSRDTTTQRMGPAGGIMTVNEEYTFDYTLEHNNDEEYVKIAVKPDHVYETYVKEVNSWDTPPAIRAMLDDYYGVFALPYHGCWNPYTSYAVFKTLEFTEATRDYFVRVRVLDSGGGSGKIAIKLLDTSGTNLDNYSNHCG